MSPRLLITCIVLFLFTTGVLLLYSRWQKNTSPAVTSNYEIYRKAPFNQPQYYPAKQATPPSYQPIAAWSGRLILPTETQRQTNDSVEFEVYTAPDRHQDLVGQTIALTWQDQPKVKRYLEQVTQTIAFTSETEDSQKAGNVHPDRLNQRQQVGALASLAGARPEDDVIVRLAHPEVQTQNGKTVLAIAQDPVQITGRFYGLVTIQARRSADTFSVVHFNLDSRQFDGRSEIIRIPQVPADRGGILRSTPEQIEASPLNAAGWYIYGANDAAGVFTVQAIAPRAPLRLQPDEVILGRRSGLRYIDRRNWKVAEAQKGTAQTVLLDPTAEQAGEAIKDWQLGDRAIVIHVFGGIGGDKAEPTNLGIVTGHFSYGIAEVVRDPFTQELRFQIEYQQVYAHNPDGIVAGSIDWAGYMGNLQRGWLGTRPVSDILVRLDAVTEDYDFDGIKLSPLTEFRRQLQVMTARYRSGDGTGAAIVTPATSCVQDSNQALYGTIRRIEQRVAANSQIQAWLRQHPGHPQTRRFQQLVNLGRSLERQLVPLGIVRSDWQQNVEFLAGTRSTEGFIRSGNVFAALTTWRTMLPRRAHDEIARLLLRHQAKLWVIRTNQVGGYNPNITPLAPTYLLSG